jgi:hypothetical protein
LPGSTERSEEQIDVVGLKQKRLQLVGECKWTQRELPFSVLDDLRTCRIPSILRAKTVRAAGQDSRVLLFARNGFSDSLREAADDDERITLGDAEDLVAGLA